MDPATTALVLLGFQRDFFAADGLLHEVIDDVGDEVLTRTLALLTGLAGSPVLLVSTPIVFTPSYEELVDPVGVLRLIQERRAFQSGEPGAETLPELAPFEHVIVELPGKRGLDAFTDTELDALLRSRGVNDVVLAGGHVDLHRLHGARRARAGLPRVGAERLLRLAQRLRAPILLRGDLPALRRAAGVRRTAQPARRLHCSHGLT